MSTNQVITIIDGYGLVFRAYYTQDHTITQYGKTIGAVYGFLSILIKLLKTLKPQYLCIALDSGGKNFRHKIYPDYKKNRKPLKPELIEQLPLIRKAIAAMNIRYIEQSNCEADDIIASLVYRMQNNYSIYIVSSDKDLAQLVNDSVVIYEPITKQILNTQTVTRKFGAPPAQLADFFALVGDRTDNIPGVGGIGRVAAAKLIKNFNTLEELYNNLHHPDVVAYSRKLLSDKAAAFLSRDLVHLSDELLISVNIEDLRWKIDAKIYDFLKSHNFSSLEPRISALDQIMQDSDLR
ncbi:putative PolA 5'-3' exonuclease domain protein [Rickettsiales endosymbiont of Paramecium tredecaurelia]|uniref:5'-3' exonuclease n=1 Tax=Candidatus Sarmatiella mevalonica TaxID=2770581 RepID=UPI001920D1E8|nr:5'-3' exonuclease H3TH domain-containing protein [Candidatus Sarmatiella mevalonica]MBL3284647.1 putative PolA 5'-3' exonuclease domain protein [Candidatus Sarmatiella mevalonica]